MKILVTNIVWKNPNSTLPTEAEIHLSGPAENDFLPEADIPAILEEEWDGVVKSFDHDFQ